MGLLTSKMAKLERSTGLDTGSDSNLSGCFNSRFIGIFNLGFFSSDSDGDSIDCSFDLSPFNLIFVDSAPLNLPLLRPEDVDLVLQDGFMLSPPNLPLGWSVRTVFSSGEENGVGDTNILFVFGQNLDISRLRRLTTQYIFYFSNLIACKLQCYCRPLYTH